LASRDSGIIVRPLDRTAIWKPDEAASSSEHTAVIGESCEIQDPRQVPEYNMFYRQSVNTEDIFLQVGMLHSLVY